MDEYLKMWREMEEEEMETNSSKKRKFYGDRLENYGGEVESPANSASPAASMTSGCTNKHEEYSNDDVLKRNLISPADLEDVDLQCDVYETENSTSVDCVFSRETTPTSELYYGDSEQILTTKSTTPPSISCRKIAANSPSPSPAELEDFFAAAENYEQQRFVEKYNYDIVKDVPLEGRYQWVRLHL